MKIYNTLERRKVDFIPLEAGKVSFYVCGPTVYNHIHIGNARTFISFDVIRRYLEHLGYQVHFVQNITDVDDKIINQALIEGIGVEDVAAKYTEAFITAMDMLGVKKPTVQPKATEEIAEMLSIIETLIENEHAYEVDGDVFFMVRSYKDYGELSRRNIDQLLSGARVDIDERKIDAADFALWKSAKPDEPAWDSPWGKGRPGWHIECSAMSQRYLGNEFDIHGGGEDLIFPHHENEIAQSKASGATFARYWLHSGMLTINEEKMSKSTGNYLLLKDALEHVRPQALRLLMLQSHYRSPFDYSPERLDEATASLLRVENALRSLDWASDGVENNNVNEVQTEQLHTRIAATTDRFKEQMDDDFNTAGAVAAIFDLISQANTCIAAGAAGPRFVEIAALAAFTIRKLLGVLGVELTTNDGDDDTLPIEVINLAQTLSNYSGDNTSEAIDSLLNLRAQARSDKDWTTADAVRDGLIAFGLIIEDTDSGTRVYMPR